MNGYAKQKQHLMNLARRFCALADKPENDIKRQRWALHNDLISTELPLLWVCPDDDGAWLELVPEKSLLCEDSELRQLERKLLQYLYQAEHFRDDFVFEPCVYQDIPGEYTGYHYGKLSQRAAWGYPINKQKAGWRALKMEEVIKTPADYDTLLSHEVDFIQDSAELARLDEKLTDAVNGIIDIRFLLPYSVLVQALLIDLVHLRGLQPLMMDLMDEPDLVDRVLRHMAQSKERLLLRLEKERRLFDNRINIYTGSGSLGYTTQPRKDDADIRLSDMWGFADAQEFSHVSPAMFERFALANQKLGLNHFGMGCYGCCEPLDNRYEAVFRHITNLRRISVSPWSDIKLAAEKIGKKAIFSWKPNPAMISSSFDETAVTKLLEYVKQTAAGCHLEIILKDLRTCGNTNQYIKHFIALTDRVFDRPAAGKEQPT